MPSLSQHQSNDYTKMLVMGDSGSGKTGALASLVGAGYKLRILDMDNGLDALKQFVQRDYPNLIDNVDFRTIQDKRKATPTGSVIDGTPKAYIDALRMLDNWKYKDDDGTEVDLGKPFQWGPECILVIDSLTFLSNAAYDWAELLTPAGKGGVDPRAIYGNAQGGIENVLATIQSKGMETNVIVIAHVKYIERDDGRTKGYPTSVGSALSPNIPTYFNSVALFETSTGGKRTIKTQPTSMIDLKNPKPFAMAKEYPIETGLADFFAVLRNPPKAERPKLTLTRKA